MEHYIQVSFTDCNPEKREILIALLADAGFSGFEEESAELRAFLAEKDYEPDALLEIAGRLDCAFTATQIESRNWNAIWESGFQPVIVDDFVTIRAGFHPPATGVKHEIIITPKMSFGTGHHATTYLMISMMQHQEFAGKKVFDFGTGTGVLAILAEKLGAAEVLAIDNDEWSITNAKENIEMNQSKLIRIEQADSAAPADKSDIILANINKNVILENLVLLKQELKPSGRLLISGLLNTDETDILEAAAAVGLQFLDISEKNNWICLLFTC